MNKLKVILFITIFTVIAFIVPFFKSVVNRYYIFDDIEFKRYTKLSIPFSIDNDKSVLLFISSLGYKVDSYKKCVKDGYAIFCINTDLSVFIRDNSVFIKKMNRDLRVIDNIDNSEYSIDLPIEQIVDKDSFLLVVDSIINKYSTDYVFSEISSNTYMVSNTTEDGYVVTVFYFKDKSLLTISKDKEYAESIGD